MNMLSEEEFYEQFNEQFEILVQEVYSVILKFPNELNMQEVKKSIVSIAEAYENKAQIHNMITKQLACQMFTDIGGEYFEENDMKMGLKYLRYAQDLFSDTNVDEVIYYLRYAQYYIETGDMEKGIIYLKKLCCETVENYEEAIDFRGLTSVWEKYRYLVEGEVPPSLSTISGNAPCLPEDCSKAIEDILCLTKNDLLIELSQHLSEISGYGDSMNWLNKWEKIIYDVNEFCTCINADGVDYFMSSCGQRFNHTKVALETIGSEKGLYIIEMIQAKFPKGKVPKSAESIENRMMAMLDKDETIFDDIEEYFYDNNISVELEDKMYQFIMSNKERFR